MANAKYDNLNVLLSTGKLNWMNDVITGVLVSGVTYNASDKTVADAIGDTGHNLSKLPVQGKEVGPDGSFRGWPIAFQAVEAGESYQMLLVKDSFSGSGELLAFFDTDDADNQLAVANSGTLILRPIVVQGAEPPLLGVWLTP
jgi:hypothetical protein